MSSTKLENSSIVLFMNSNNMFGTRLKFLREEKGLSMEQLANAVEVSNASICMWEHGNTEPRASQIVRFARFFSCSTDYLMGNTDDMGYYIPSDPLSVSVNADEMQLLDSYRKLNKNNQKLLIETAKAWKVSQ